MLIPWIILMLECLCSKLFYDLIPNNNTTVCIIVITVNALSVCVGIAFAYREKHEVIYMMLGGFLFRLALFFWDMNFRDIFLLPASGLDTETYANAAAEGFWTGKIFRGGWYPKFIAFWYNYFKLQRPIAQYINILMAMTAISVVIATMNYLKMDSRVKSLITALMCFLPNSAIIHSILLRETLIMFLLACCLYFFVRYFKEGGIHWLIISMALVIIATPIHSGAIAVLVGETLALILYDRRDRSMRVTPKTIALAVVTVLVFLTAYTLFQDELFGKFRGADSAEDIIDTVRLYNSGGSAYDAGFNISNPTLNLIVNTPIRMFYFLSSPLPWNWRGIEDIISFCFSSSVYIYALYRAFVEIRRSARSERRSLIIVFTIIALCCALFFAWGVSNAGTAMRHREKFLMVYLILIALSNDNRVMRIKSMPVRKKIGNDYD